MASAEQVRNQLRGWAADQVEGRPEGEPVDAEGFVHVGGAAPRGSASGSAVVAGGVPLSAAVAPRPEGPKRSGTAARLDRWEEKLNKYPVLHQLEAATGVRALWITIGAAALLFAFVFFGLGMGVVCVVVGFLFPVYQSYKTIEKPQPELLRNWLMYWVVYGIFSTLESYSDKGLSWVPLYYPLKLAFLMWCFLPKYNGATKLFQGVLRPVLKSHEGNIEELHQSVHVATTETVEATVRVLRDSTQHIRRISYQWMSAATATRPATGASVTVTASGAATATVVPPTPLAAVEEEGVADGAKKAQ